MNKEEWINGFTTGRYKKADKDVIEFIANILYHNNKETGSNAIYNLFSCGYCYYFAIMLKDAFGRGEVCWHRNHGHIVWLDETDIAYDIGGVFEDYNDGDLLPIDDSLGEMICDFKHNGQKFNMHSEEFSNWASFYKMNDYEAATLIYMEISEDEINDNISVAGNVLLYWYKHERELSQKFALRKENNREIL